VTMEEGNWAGWEGTGCRGVREGNTQQQEVHGGAAVELRHDGERLSDPRARARKDARKGLGWEMGDQVVCEIAAMRKRKIK
jgi:hypothetical protein